MDWLIDGLLGFMLWQIEILPLLIVLSFGEAAILLAAGLILMTDTSDAHAAG